MAIPDSMKNIRGRGRPRLVKIPESFQVLGHTVQVRIVDEKTLVEVTGDDAADNSALYDPGERVIYLLDTLSGDDLEQVFLHEKTHCILEHAGREDLSSDEAFVELFSQIDFQIAKSLKYPRRTKDKTDAIL